MGLSHGRMLHQAVSEMMHGLCCGFDEEHAHDEMIQQSLDRMIACMLHHLAYNCKLTWNIPHGYIEISSNKEGVPSVETKPSHIWKAYASITQKIQQLLDEGAHTQPSRLPSEFASRVIQTLSMWMIQECLTQDSPLLNLEMSFKIHLNGKLDHASRERLTRAVVHDLRTLRASPHCIAHVKTLVEGYSRTKVMNYTLKLWRKASLMATRLHHLSTTQSIMYGKD